jgi:hypothetical protein
LIRFLVHGNDVLLGVWGRMVKIPALGPETGAAERMFVIFRPYQQIPGLCPKLSHIRFFPHPSHQVMLLRLYNDVLSEFQPLFAGSSALIVANALTELCDSSILCNRTKRVTKF